MKRKATACLVALFMLAGCNDKKLVVKKIPVRPGLNLIWYHYSLISGNGPDYVEFEDSITGAEEVIFEAQEICRIQVHSDSINILMEGSSILMQAQQNSYKCKLVVDTTCRGVYLYK